MEHCLQIHATASYEARITGDSTTGVGGTDVQAVADLALGLKQQLDDARAEIERLKQRQYLLPKDTLLFGLPDDALECVTKQMYALAEHYKEVLQLPWFPQGTTQFTDIGEFLRSVREARQKQKAT